MERTGFAGGTLLARGLPPAPPLRELSSSVRPSPDLPPPAAQPRSCSSSKERISRRGCREERRERRDSGPGKRAKRAKGRGLPEWGGSPWTAAARRRLASPPPPTCPSSVWRSHRALVLVLVVLLVLETDDRTQRTRQERPPSDPSDRSDLSHLPQPRRRDAALLRPPPRGRQCPVWRSRPRLRSPRSGRRNKAHGEASPGRGTVGTPMSIISAREAGGGAVRPGRGMPSAPRRAPSPHSGAGRKRKRGRGCASAQALAPASRSGVRGGRGRCRGGVPVSRAVTAGVANMAPLAPGGGDSVAAARQVTESQQSRMEAGASKTPSPRGSLETRKHKPPKNAPPDLRIQVFQVRFSGGEDYESIGHRWRISWRSLPSSARSSSRRGALGTPSRVAGEDGDCKPRRGQ